MTFFDKKERKRMQLVNTIKDVFGKRKIVMSLAQEDFRKRFVGSYFGVF